MERNYDDLQNCMEQYLTKSDIDKVQRAYFFSRTAHEGQSRKSGEPYIIHPIAVAIVLAKLKMTSTVLISALLHDVVEDTKFTKEDISAAFGEDVANIVESVTKLGNIQGLSNDFVQAENHRKIIIATAKDMRVILVKLADRVHNMRTISYMNTSKQKLIANETLEVYAPIAHRLGMYQIKWELEDLSFRCINREAYDSIAAKINMKRSERDELVNDIVISTKSYLEERGLKTKIYGRTKHIYSIYKKITQQKKDFDDLMDLFAFRIVVDTIPECYTVLGAIHEKYKPIPMKFKDYIPTPKHNMYQSIHTTVVSDYAIPVEFQIRTKKMDIEAELGIASHWMYKENVEFDEVQIETQKRLGWLREAMELGEDIDPRTFMNQVKLDFFSKNLIVYTPKGDVIEMPEGSTILDFAYYIHSNVGNTAVSAKVNEKVVSLFYKLEIGDIVQVITNDIAQPSLSYIQKVKTNRAKESLRKYFKEAEKVSIEIEGRKSLVKYAIDCNIFDIKSRLESEEVLSLARSFECNEVDELYYRIGSGLINLKDVILYLQNEDILDTDDNDIVIEDDVENSNYRFCKYCSPIPGDVIYATQVEDGYHLKKYFVHREVCKIKNNMSGAHFTALSKNMLYVCRITLEVDDKAQSISKVLVAIAHLNYNITSIYFRGGLGNVATGRISLQVHNKENVDLILSQLQSLDNVKSAARIIEGVNKNENY